jgi:hypothetical protein
VNFSPDRSGILLLASLASKRYSGGQEKASNRHKTDNAAIFE